MTAYVFPGQGSQFPGMGKELCDRLPSARDYFQRADDLLGFSLSRLMADGSAEDLQATRVTQPAVFLHSVAMALAAEVPTPDVVAGHSLGEFSALAVSGALSFEDALLLVQARAGAMQRCCEQVNGTMAAIIGLDDAVVEEVCAAVPGRVVPANYNSRGQVVISGEKEAVARACVRLKEAGARRALPLAVGGAFHSPLMEPAREELAAAIDRTTFRQPRCPIYQNVTAAPETDPLVIKANLLAQLTAPVRWTQSVVAMVEAGVDRFVEFGPGSVLQGLIRKTVSTEGLVVEGFSF